MIDAQVINYLKKRVAYISDHEEIKIKKALLTFLSLLLIVAGFCWAALYYCLGYTITSLIPLAFSVSLSAVFITYVFFKKYKIFLYSQLFLILLLPFVVQLTLGGFEKSGVVFLWAILAPIGAFMFHTPKSALFFFCLYLCLLAILTLSNNVQYFETNQPTKAHAQIFFCMNIGALCSIVFAALWYFVTTLIQEHERSESLLQEKEGMLRKTFQLYMPKDDLERILVDSEKGVQRGGKMENMAILFSDIRGFTTISEKLSPGEVVELLNEFFNNVNRIAIENGGTVDKFIGDAVLIRFPEDAATKSLDTAVSMIRELRVLNEKREKASRFQINIGIGIAFGPVVMGNIGSYDRMDFTVIGDTVNLASRLTGLNKNYFTRILISDAMFIALNQSNSIFHARFLDYVKVKGKIQPTAVYEIFDADTPQVFAKKKETVLHFEKGVQSFQSGVYDDSAKNFLEVIKNDPSDATAVSYLHRTAQNIVNRSSVLDDQNLFIPWSKEYSVGVDAIDDQHKQLFDIINELHLAKSKDSRKNFISNILKRLVVYTIAHFSVEEELMLRHSYDMYSHHKESHEKFKAEIGGFIEEFKSGKTELSDAILDFLKDWLQEHIAGEDKALGKYFENLH